MIRSTPALLCLACLALVGCAETAPPPAVTPSPTLHRPATWQQFCEQSWNVQHASSLAQARGAEGWELVAMYNGVLCYKRPAFDMRPQQPQGASPNAPLGLPYVPQVRDPGF